MSRHPFPLLTREVAPIVIDPATTCLLLQDLHAPFADPDHGWIATRVREKVVAREFDEYFETLRLIAPNIPTLAGTFRERGIPLLYSCFGHHAAEAPSTFQHATGLAWNLDGPDGAFPDGWRPVESEQVYSKPGWGALANKALEQHIRDTGICSVVIVGTMLDFGIRQTCTELADRGIGSLIVSDAVCGLTAAGQAHTAGNIAHGLTKLRSTAELLDLLALLDSQPSVTI